MSFSTGSLRVRRGFSSVVVVVRSGYGNRFHYLSLHTTVIRLSLSTRTGL